MKKTIYLTEQDIHQMIKESVQTLLLEASTPDAIYKKRYSNIDRDIFDTAMIADPTTVYNQQGQIKKVGGYVEWIMNLFKDGKWTPDDSNKTKEVLSKFDKLKNSSHFPDDLKNINSYSSVSDLENNLQPYLGIKSNKEIKQEEATKVYEDEQWEIIIPHTEKASCIYGANTCWCTAAKNNNKFDNYYYKGLLFINIYKPRNEKFQFHFETSSFRDENNKPIKPSQLPWTEGALNYYKSINKYVYFIFDWVDEFYNGIARVKLNNKYTWFSLEKKDYLFPNKWFQWVEKFENGIAIVKLNDKYNWFDKNKGELVWDKPIEQWFDRVENFYNGIAYVKLNGKYYKITLDGQLLDNYTKQPLSQEQVQELFQQQQQIDEMVNRLVKNYLR